MIKEIELKKHRCCFTGHRPEKLSMPEDNIKAALEFHIQAAIEDGYQTFISGMARGVDLWAAESVLHLRTKGLPIRLICASPYEGFEVRWNTEWQKMYRRVLACADLVKFICRKYSPNCFQLRNQWMVDHSGRIIAVYNGTYGGTRSTLEYAVGQGISIIQI